MSEQYQLEEAIFAAAGHLPADQRAAFVEAACGANNQMLERVRTRLSTHQTAPPASPSPMQDEPTASGNGLSHSDPFPASPRDLDETITTTIGSPVALPRGVEESPGDFIGRYKLLEKIGEGGFGVVYMAEQQEPVIRRVALKITKLGMDTKQVIGRFEAERQALALMNHPNIANVIDGGATETGRPFFVMELVRGIKITDYCDHNNVPLRKRLALFIQVCQAIEHAHQKGIIHRDIKPSNILVTLHDGVPVCKVIDFGIAKATQGILTDKTVFTQFDQFVGTPAYMSPEQAEMSGLEIDSRTDIYSLGVLLYELLTGHTPFEAKGLLSRGFDEMRRIIREIEPLRPSNRLGTQTGEELTSTAIQQGTDAPKLISLVRGDLDWVVMKCLEKDRTRRYESAGELGKEIQRFLTHEPVMARPPSPIYRLQKLVMRNRFAFSTGTVFFTFLTVALCVTTYYVIKEKDARDLADNATKGAVTARQNADTARITAQKAFQQSEAERKSADAERLKAQAALVQSEADRAKAETAEKKALESQKEAEAARQETESALQQSIEDRKIAQPAQTRARIPVERGKVSDSRMTPLPSQNPAAIKSGNEVNLRQEAEIAQLQADDARDRAQTSEAMALAKAANSEAAISNIIARLSALPPAEALKAASVLFTPQDELQPWGAQILRRRGEWHALQGDWTNAAQDFTKSLNVEPGNVEAYRALAPLLAQEEDWDTYNSLRSRFLAGFENTNVPADAPALAMDWLLKPLPPSEMTKAQTLAQSAAGLETNNPELPQSQLALGLAEYRQGHATAALDLTQKAVAGSARNPAWNAQANSVLALIQHDMKQPDDAQATLARAKQIADTGMAKLATADPGPDWRDWIIARALLQEAAGTILPSSAGK